MAASVVRLLLGCDGERVVEPPYDIC